VLVGRSLRMSIDTCQRINAAAIARGTTWSALVREWIEQGLQAGETGAAPNPIAGLLCSMDARESPVAFGRALPVRHLVVLLGLATSR
jgi:hypothetical protein